MKSINLVTLAPVRDAAGAIVEVVVSVSYELTGEVEGTQVTVHEGKAIELAAARKSELITWLKSL